MADYGGGSSVTLGAGTVTAVLPNRVGRRISFSIANVGANAAYIEMSNVGTAVAGSGCYLGSGGVLTDTSFPGIPCWQGAISGVSTAGGTSLAVWERVLL